MEFKNSNGMAKFKWGNPTQRSKYSPLFLFAALICSFQYSAWAGVDGEISGESPIEVFLKHSKPQNNYFNYVFAQRLKASADRDHSNNSAEKYLLSLPALGEYGESETEPSCRLSLALNQSSPLAPEVQESYCQLQKSWSRLNPNHLGVPEIPGTKKSGPVGDGREEVKLKDRYTEAMTRLADPQNDTLVIIIPGIFGEFIDQTAFGEIFHQGQRAGSPPSSFEKKFKEVRSVLSEEERRNFWMDQRFLLKNLLPDSNKKLEDFEALVEMPRWIQVASVDNIQGLPIFKTVVLGLEAMSLESLGSQDRLARLYLRRLNKFMKVYEKMYGSLPQNIIFVGYSRGFPIGLEMLAQISEKRSKNSDTENDLRWAENIRSVVSLGGVAFGTALADRSAVSRPVLPPDVQVLLAVKNLLFKYVHLPESVLTNVLDEYIGVATNQRDPSPGYGENRKALISAIATNSALLSNFVEQIKRIAIENPEMADSLNLILKKQRRNLSLIQRVIRLKNFKEKMDSGKLNEVLQEDLIPLYRDLISLFKELAEQQENSRPGASGDLLTVTPDPLALLAFSKKLSANWGIDESFAAVQSKKDLETKIKSSMIESNRNMFRLSHYFRAAWVGGMELSLDARLKWWKNRGHLIPTQIRYYTVAGTLGEESQSFYKAGVGYGYDSASMDQAFLNRSWNNLRRVGLRSSKDGIDLTHVGSEVNDSQVDWYKTILWPHLVKDLTGGLEIKSEFLGFVRTHHWGLALPFSFATRNPNQGNKVIVNPFPRAELLEAIVISTVPENPKK